MVLETDDKGGENGEDVEDDVSQEGAFHGLERPHKHYRPHHNGRQKHPCSCRVGRRRNGRAFVSLFHNFVIYLS